MSLSSNAVSIFFEFSAWANLGYPNSKNSLTSINMNAVTGTAGGTLPTELGLLVDLQAFEFNQNGLTCKFFYADCTADAARKFKHVNLPVFFWCLQQPSQRKWA